MGLFRLILALAVVLGHGAGYPELVFVNGDTAVFCFFIISGFYMALLLDTVYAGRPIAFYLNRALRLYPAYFFVLFVSILYREYMTGEISVFFRSGIEPKIHAVISNVFFLGMDYLRFNAPIEFGYPKNWRLVPQAWSLDVEVMFYAVAPLFLMIKNKNTLIKPAVLFLVGLLALKYRIELKEWMLWITLPDYLLFFACGSISYSIYVYIRQAAWLNENIILSIAMSLGAAIVITSYLADIYNARTIGLKNSLLYLAITLWLPFLFVATRNFKIDRYIGELSYPIYLVHWLIIRIMNDYGLNVYQWKSTVGVVVATVVASMIIHHGIELPIEKLRMIVRSPSKA